MTLQLIQSFKTHVKRQYMHIKKRTEFQLKAKNHKPNL